MPGCSHGKWYILWLSPLSEHLFQNLPWPFASTLQPSRCVPFTMVSITDLMDITRCYELILMPQQMTPSSTASWSQVSQNCRILCGTCCFVSFSAFSRAQRTLLQRLSLFSSCSLGAHLLQLALCLGLLSWGCEQGSGSYQEDTRCSRGACSV